MREGRSRITQELHPGYKNYSASISTRPFSTVVG
jgi:hypothetical protein